MNPARPKMARSPHRARGGIGDVGEQRDRLTETDPRGIRVERRRTAVVLLSGGLDSATVLAVARSRGHDCHALTVDYGQRHRLEIDAAALLAVHLGAVSHRIIELDLRAFGGSALTDDIDVPHPSSPDEIGASVPTTYVPARNTVLLSLALAWAEVLEARDLYIGANARDYSGYPDCRREFLEAFERVANLGTVAGTEGERRIRVRAPLVDLGKAEIIHLGAELGVPFHLTHSCYDPDPSGAACGLCDSCILRRRGFKDAGIDDPTSYADPT